MKQIASILAIMLPPLLCSCSALQTGLYIVPSSQEGLVEMTNDYWRTLGFAPRGSGARYTNTIEAAVGTMRPPVYERHFDEGLRFVTYPTIISERGLLFGPMFLPIIPIFLIPQETPDSVAARYRVRILWRGDVEKARRITVYCVISGNLCQGMRAIARMSNEVLECEYVFNEQIADGSELLLDYSSGDKIVRLPFTYRRGIQYVPILRIMNAPHPVTPEAPVMFMPEGMFSEFGVYDDTPDGGGRLKQEQ